MQAARQRDQLRHRRNNGDGCRKSYGLLVFKRMMRRSENGAFRNQIAEILMRRLGRRTGLARAGTVGARCFDLLRVGGGGKTKIAKMSGAIIDRMREQGKDEQNRHAEETAARLALASKLALCLHV